MVAIQGLGFNKKKFLWGYRYFLGNIKLYFTSQLTWIHEEKIRKTHFGTLHYDFPSTFTLFFTKILTISMVKINVNIKNSVKPLTQLENS